MGALIHFLSPYSPDYNSIEEAVSKVKTNLRAMDVKSEDPEDIVMAAFSSITVNDCQKWIGHVGIYNRNMYA